MSSSREAAAFAPGKPARLRKIIVGLLCAGAVFFLADWVAGGFLIAPAQCRMVLPAANGYTIEAVTFPSASGASIKGWLVPAADSKGVVILMHGVRSHRATMTNRVPFLHAAGYAVLLFDFQAHGESIGRHITFGYLESRDATAAVNYVHHRFPGKKTAVLGVSMGGAAILLAQPRLAVNAEIVESVYPTIKQAVEDRLVARAGVLGKYAAPLITWQLKPRLGIGLDDLCPIDQVGQITVPKFFLAGEADRDTTVAESQALFAAAAEPKQLWIVPGAIHEDLCHFAPELYQKQVLAFLAANLK